MYKIYKAINTKTNKDYFAEIVNKTKISRDEVLFYVGILEHIGYVRIIYDENDLHNPIIERVRQANFTMLFSFFNVLARYTLAASND